MWKWIQGAALIAVLAMAAPACAAAVPNIQKVEVVADEKQMIREQADLHAQQVAAWWTRFAAIASLGSILVGAGGLLLILRQLSHSEDANRQAAAGAAAAAKAAEAAIATSRAWIRLTAAPHTLMLEKPGGWHLLELPIHWKNIGATPAVGVWNVARPTDRNQPIGKQLEDMGRGTGTLGRTMFPDEEGRQTWMIDLPPHGLGPLGDWDVIAAVFYQLPGDPVPKMTAQRFRVGKIRASDAVGGPGSYDASVAPLSDYWIEPT